MWVMRGPTPGSTDIKPPKTGQRGVTRAQSSSPARGTHAAQIRTVQPSRSLLGVSETVDLFHQKLELSCDQKPVWAAELTTRAGHLPLTGSAAPEARRSGLRTSGVSRRPETSGEKKTRGDRICLFALSLLLAAPRDPCTHVEAAASTRARLHPNCLTMAKLLPPFSFFA